MQVYIIRHGQSMANLERRCAGWAQVHLSDLGRSQASAAAGLVKDIRFDRVYCSDLLRARETCALALPGYEPIVTPALREVGVGSISGMLYAELFAEGGETFAAREKDQDFSAYGGESPADISSRIHGFIRDELEPLASDPATADAHIALVGHEGTVHRFLTYVTGCDIPLTSIHIANASISQFSYEGGRWRLEAWSYQGRLLYDNSVKSHSTRHACM